jgi:hypothetical protein
MDLFDDLDFLYKDVHDFVKNFGFYKSFHNIYS